MKSIRLLAIAITILLSSCNGTKKDKEENATSGITPQTEIKVNKEYDKNGNIIRFDSSYSSYYSNIGNNPKLRDSIFNNFKNYFNNKYSFSNRPFFNDFFFQDSLLKYDFYKKDFFANRYKNNQRRMDSLFWGMDSLKNNFFYNYFKPPLVPGK